MTFFYDLNKKLSDLADKQTLTEGKKPDFLDMDKDGDKKEPMKKAVADKKKNPFAKKSEEELEEGILDTVKHVGGKVLDKLGHGSDEDLIKDLQRKAGLPQTGKKPSGPAPTGHPMDANEGVDKEAFAALAEPKDKITFADKIAGAKKEVDEMLGDVAASAMKRAVSHMEEDDDNNPFTNWKKPRPDKPKVGSVERGALHDIEHTATGRKVTRRVDPNTGHSVGSDDDKPAAGEKRGRGRPAGKGAGKSIGARGPSGKSKLMKREGADDIQDQGEYDQEGDMALDDINTIESAANELQAIIDANENLPEWVQSKINKAMDYLDTARDYMSAQEDDEEIVDEKAPPGTKAERMVKGIKKSLSKDGKLSDKDKSIAYATAWKAKKAGKVEEESDGEEDNKAEKAGKKVTKDIEHDEGHKGKDDKKAEKAGKKVTKDIEYDDKKDKKEEVEETTTSGSVAPAASGKAKGSMQFGKGVYESFNNKVEAILAESLSVNANMDTEGHNSLTVTASDEDALKLAELLKMAGLGGESYKEVCPGCGSGDCGCDQVEEELANSADNTVYADTDYMVDELSGGLNGRKSTGQTVNAPLNRDPARQVSMVENTLWNLYKQYDKK